MADSTVDRASLAVTDTNLVGDPRRSSGRFSLYLGLGLAIWGVLIYIAQVRLAWLSTPWYLPLLATLGAVCIAVSLWYARSLWRILAFLFVVLLAGAEWAFLLSARLPDYAGPVAVDQPFPPFDSVRADGEPFNERSLPGDRNTVLVFFRGRW